MTPDYVQQYSQSNKEDEDQGNGYRNDWKTDTS